MKVDYDNFVAVFPSFRVDGRIMDESVSVAYDKDVCEIVLTDWLAEDANGNPLTMSLDLHVAKHIFQKGLELVNAVDEYFTETENE
jgi:hypothetical protein